MSTDAEKQVSPMPKLIAIYARVSTGRQENEETIKNQLMATGDLAEKNNYTIVKKYIDDGWSGDVLIRPAMDEMRGDAKKKIWDVLLVYDPDRLARRYSYQELVMDEVQEAGKEIIFITIPAPKNAEEKVMYGMRGIFAEWERMKIIERFRLGKLRKAREGHLLLSQPKYGYHYTPKQDRVHGFYTVNDSEARVVNMIFNFVDKERMTIRGMIKRLLEMEIKPRKSKRGVWSTSTLSTMLHDRTYIGEGHYLRSYGVVPQNPTNKQIYKKNKKSSRKLRPTEEWIKIPVPAIIDKDVFDRVQKITKDNYVMCQRNKKNEYLLAGKIYCPCGRRRAGEGPMHGKHLYYRCTDRVYTHPLPRNCFEKGINARIADELVWKKVVELMNTPELLLAQVERWLTVGKANVRSFDKSADQMEKDANKIKKQIDRFNQAYGNGAFTLEQLMELTTPLKAALAELERQIIEVRQEEDRVKTIVAPNKDEIEAFAQEAVKALGGLNFKAKKAIIGFVLEKVVGTQKELQVSGYIPITTSNYVGFETNHRHRRPA